MTFIFQCGTQNEDKISIFSTVTLDLCTSDDNFVSNRQIVHNSQIAKMLSISAIQYNIHQTQKYI